MAKLLKKKTEKSVQARFVRIYLFNPFFKKIV